MERTRYRANNNYCKQTLGKLDTWTSSHLVLKGTQAHQDYCINDLKTSKKGLCHLPVMLTYYKCLSVKGLDLEGCDTEC